MNRKKHMKKSTFIKIIGVFWLAISLLVFGIIELMMGAVYTADINLQDYIEVKASVISVNYPATDSQATGAYNVSVGGSNLTVYEYFDKNKTKHRVEKNFTSSSIKQGQTINVYYKKTNPDDSIPEILVAPPKAVIIGLNIFKIFAFVGSGIIIAIGFIVESRDKKRREGIA